MPSSGQHNNTTIFFLNGGALGLLLGRTLVITMEMLIYLVWILTMWTFVGLTYPVLI